MNPTWQRYLDLANGLTRVTQRSAETVVKNLVKQGEVAADRAERTVDDLLRSSESNRKAVAAMVKSETERAIGALGLVTQRDLDKLQRKVDSMQGAGGKAAKAAKSAPATKAAPVKKSAAARRAAASVDAATQAAVSNAAPGAIPATSNEAAGKRAAAKANARTAKSGKADGQKKPAGKGTGKKAAAAGQASKVTAGKRSSKQSVAKQASPAAVSDGPGGAGVTPQVAAKKANPPSPTSPDASAAGTAAPSDDA